MAQQSNRIVMLVNDEISNPHLPCKDAIYEFLKLDGGFWSVHELFERLNCLRASPFHVNKRRIIQALNALIKEGEVECVEFHGEDRYRYVPAEDYKPPIGAKVRNPAHEQFFEQRIWNAIRVLKTFTAPYAAMTANTERGFTERYIKRLMAPKFVVYAGTQGDKYRFNSARDPGPKAPYLAMSLVMVNPNTNKIIDIIDSERADPWL